MTGRSHLLIGGFSVFCGMRWHMLSADPSCLLAGLVGSILPDIDTERSMIGARCRPVSRFLARALGHRGLTHSGIVLLVTVGMVAEGFGERVLHGPMGALLLGIGTHIAADLPTGGCQLLAPLSRSRISFWPYVRTGSIGEVVLLLPVLFLLGWVGMCVPASHPGKKTGYHQRFHAHVLKGTASSS